MITHTCTIIPLLDYYGQVRSSAHKKASNILKLVDYEKYLTHSINGKGVTYYNLNGTALSLLAQTKFIGCKMLLLMKTFFEEYGLTVGALIHDGFNIGKRIKQKCIKILLRLPI